MIYLLDASAVVAILRNRPAQARKRLREAKTRGAGLRVPSIVLFELWYGVARSQDRNQNADRLRVFLSGEIGVLPFEERDAAIAGDLRQALEAAGTGIGAYDLLIAAQAVRTKATLVTANRAEFARVPGLDCEDWTADS